MLAKYFTALIFCCLRSSACFTSAAFLIAGLGDCKFAGSASGLSGGFFSRPGCLPVMFGIVFWKCCTVCGMPRKRNSVGEGGGAATWALALLQARQERESAPSS